MKTVIVVQKAIAVFNLGRHHLTTKDESVRASTTTSLSSASS